MFRRRRPVREIEFSFDSFLDVVANIVGIILRLILVAWVGARTYKAVVPVLPPLPPLTAPVPLPDPTDPRLARIEHERRTAERMAEEVQRTREKRRQEIVLHAQDVQKELARLADEEKALQKKKTETVQQAAHAAATVQSVEMTLSQLEKRSRGLLDELEKLRKAPRLTKKLRYRTPVSAPLQTEEVTFECHHGKVTVVEVGRMLEEAQREAQNRNKELMDRWQITGSTRPAGAYRMQYVVERERTMLDAGGPPAPGSFRSGITAWIIEPLTPDPGERLDVALKPGSMFHRVIDALDPQQTAITFWVYPDSFAMYRKLRDSLHERDFVVAGRPLNEGDPIAGSRKGSVSRGQ